MEKLNSYNKNCNFPFKHILDTVNSGKYFLGAASQWWLHHSLIALNKSLNGNLVTFKGDPLTVLMHLAETYEVSKVFFTFPKNIFLFHSIMI